MAPSLVQQLQERALSPTEAVSNLLRLSLVVASKLNQPELEEWLSLELNGYREEASFDLIPNYRRVKGRVVAWNPYNGWIPILVENAEYAKAISERTIGSSVGELEALISETDSGMLTMQFPPRLRAQLMKGAELPLEPVLHVSASQIRGILDTVRNKVLSWSLELDRAGVSGEGVSFSKSEVEAAKQVTYNIGNVGVLGNVTDNARVKNDQDIHIDLGKTADLVSKIEDLLGAFSEAEAARLREQIQLVRAELETPAPNQGLLKSALRSIRSVCEGASGNLVASGILASLAGIG